mgnify:CR=1 FL=1
MFKQKIIPALYVLPLALGCTQKEEMKRPNIIFIMSDDHSFQTISAYGHPISQLAPTPNLDRLAAEGIVCRRAFVENSISAPSRATLLTGMYSHHHGQKTLQYGIMDSTLTYFPELLQDAGYRTALIGKWHLSVEPKGFDWYDIFYDQGEYYNPGMRTPLTGGEYVRQEGYATEIVTDHALEWLSGRKGDSEPFCLLIHHKAPHRNWMPSLDDLELYEDVEFPEPATLFDDYATRGTQMRQQQLTIDEYMGYAFDFKVEELKDEPTLQYIKDSWDIAMSSLSEEQRKRWDEAYSRMNASFLSGRPEGDDLLRWKYQRYIHDYCRTIHSLDRQVGRILDYLERNGMKDNTVVIYTSDQGFYMGEHGLYDKRFMYEEALRTPLIVSWPGHIEAGTSTDAMIQNIDYAPTILDMAGVRTPEDMDGTSFKDIMLTGRIPSDWRKQIYYQYYDFPAVGSVRQHYGIRTERYKLIHWKDDAAGGLPAIDEWELFDLASDPEEVHNVFDDEGYSAVKDNLSGRLEMMKKQIQ